MPIELARDEAPGQMTEADAAALVRYMSARHFLYFDQSILDRVLQHLRQMAANGVPKGTEASLCALIAQRQQAGVKKYGTQVANNPLPLRAWLQHALEEALDQAIYLKRAIEELDKTQGETK